MLLCCMFMHTAATSDWDHFKGSLERTGSSDAPAPDTAYLEWKVDFESALYSSPVVKDGKIIQVGLEKVACISIETGDILWTSCIPAYNSTPAVSSDKIVVATNRGISALSVENGDLVWEYMVEGRFSSVDMVDYIVSSPVVDEGKVVMGTLPYSRWILDGPRSYDYNELYLVCLDEITGEEIWHMRTILGVMTSPCVAHGRVFVTSRDILCIDLESGEVLWNSKSRYPYDPFNPKKTKKDIYLFQYSTPALFHGILVGGSCVMGWSTEEPRYEGWHKIVAMDQYTRDMMWEWIGESALASSPALYEGKIYFYSYDGFVRCISFLEGEELWETRISEPREFDTRGFRLWPSPSAADGKVYIGSIEEDFYCLDAYTGEILWKYETGPIFATPAISQGRVLISSADGSLYCFGIDPETYKTKAEKYIKVEEYGKAEEFLIKAKEYAEEIREIEELLDIVDDHKKEYQERQDRIEEAESLMDRADEILWNDQFKEAQNLYKKARRIYEKVDDEFGVSFCEARIEYIQERIPEEERGIPEVYLWVLVIVICVAAAAILLKKVR